jgi:uncharacterized membrane protein
MNIHPLIVHFPIALLTIYAIFECFRAKKFLVSESWFFVKATFLFLGTLGALLAGLTGNFGKSLFQTQYAIIQTHERFAFATGVVFAILSLIYFIVLIDRLFRPQLRKSANASSWESVANIARKFFIGPVLVPVALIGLVLLIITGTLGGSIVYGVTSDPIAQLVNQLFVR